MIFERIRRTRERESLTICWHNFHLELKLRNFMKNRLRLLVILAALALVSNGCGLFVSSHHRTEDYTPVFADAAAGNVAAVGSAAAIKNGSGCYQSQKELGLTGQTLLHIAGRSQNHKDLTEVLPEGWCRCRCVDHR